MILASCEKREVITQIDPILISESGIVALINPGNTSCEELPGTYVASSGKVDYVAGEFVFEGSQTDWPFGLTVTVSEDGRYIGFELPATSQYWVGAVIAKGGNASNVYTYDSGIKSDQGLSSPINSSGNPAALSNLTFCFVECTADPVVIALKAYVFGLPSGNGFAYSVGSTSYAPLCSSVPLGTIVLVPEEIKFDMNDYYGTKVGEVTVHPSVSGSRQVDLDLTTGALVQTSVFVYVGPLSGIPFDGNCADWDAFPTPTFSDANTFNIAN